eukprot:TRINITY_DN1544_c0_g2_i1.p1 TRINITY_DN1544_c0_g2~~TRINITY_DN1544_c0_g2_i1.p1  ORF type:complete len:168 (-),score=9.44 TRINITY_DN1544_c0_g2_i1:89-592(-)
MVAVARELVESWSRGLGATSSHGEELLKCAGEAQPWAEAVELLYPAAGDQQIRAQSEEGKTRPKKLKHLAHPMRKATDRDAMEASLRDLMQHWNYEITADCCCGFHGAIAIAQSVFSQMQRKQCSHESDPFDAYQCEGCGWLFSEESVDGITECYICSAPRKQTLSL